MKEFNQVLRKARKVANAWPTTTHTEIEGPTHLRCSVDLQSITPLADKPIGTFHAMWIMWRKRKRLRDDTVRHIMQCHQDRVRDRGW